MNTDTEINEYDILLDIFRFIRDYSTDTYTLRSVCNLLLKHLSGLGYDAEITDHQNRDAFVFTVSGHKYRVLYNKGWSKYDVICTA